MLPLLLAAAVAAPGTTPETATPAKLADYGQWPSAYDWYLATPQIIQSRGLAGHATLRCKVNDVGRLARCQVVDESPKGVGFGKAAMTLRSKVRMTPVSKGEQRWLLIPFKWGEQGPYLAPTLM